MNIKMIAADLDDTLLRDDQTVSDRTVSALEKCRNKGIKVIYATARGQSAQKIVSPDWFDGYVRMSGAVAFAGEIPVYRKIISTVETRDLLLAADKAGISIAAEISGRHYTNFDLSKVWDAMDNFEISDFKTLDVEAEKMYAITKSETEIELLKSHLPKGLSINTTRYMFTMILHEEATKAKAVAALADYWDITFAEIAAFGDDTPDMGMLEYSGVGVAMGNATDEVKSAANYVCDTNENDGVVKWIEEFVL